MTKSPPFNILKHLIHREPVDPIPMIYKLNHKDEARQTCRLSIDQKMKGIRYKIYQNNKKVVQKAINCNYERNGRNGRIQR